MAKKTNIKVHLAPQPLNRFVNGFVERVWGVFRYLNEFKKIQNEMELMENHHQGVCRKNLLDTMLFFSIKDPQDPPSLPPPA